MKLVNAALFVTLLLAASTFSQGQEKNLRVDDYIKAEMESSHIPGVAVAVLRNGKIELIKGYGLANIERKIPVTPDTMFQIASTTKPFTSMGVMMLVEEGKLSLDEKVIKYLPWLPEIYSGITVRQLLTQTSGVRSDLRTGNVDNFSLEEFKRRLAAAPASFKPGERWEYANTGYIILGMLIEAVGGKPYGDFLAQRIFKPLGMNNTVYNEPPGTNPNRAIGYDWQGDAYRPSPYFAGGYSAGALISSLSDMVKWEQSLDNMRLLKRQSFEQMWTPVSLSNSRPLSFEFREEQSGYGFGWFLTSYKGHKLYTHGGTLSGFSAVINRFVNDKVTIIVLTNSKSGPDRIGYAEVLGRGIANLYLSDSSQSRKDEEQIQELIRRWDDAIVKRDTTFIDSILAEDFTYVSSSGQMQNKSQLLQSIGTSGITIESSGSSNLMIRIYGDTAVVIARGMIKGRSTSSPFDAQYLYTDVWVRQKTGWKAVATQVTNLSK
jgi:D-alanyl-D-alanine carboxypeptidase